MHKLLSAKWTYYDDFYDNRKKYLEQGVDACYVPNDEWMSELGKEYFIIWGPQTKRRSRLEVIKGTISRDSYGVPKINGVYLDKPFKNASWYEYFPRYCWSDAFDFMGIQMTEDNKLGCLVFDNEQEAREFCEKYNDWKEKKVQKEIDDYLNSDESKKLHSARLKQIQELVNSLDESDVDTFNVIDDIYDAIGSKIGWKEYIY